MPPLLNVSDGRVQTVATHYAVTELLGIGRFSEVYKAFDSATQTDVALKIYKGFDENTHNLAKAERNTLDELRDLNTEWFPKCRGGKKCRLNNQNHPMLVLELGEYVGQDGIKKIISLKDAIPSNKDNNNYIINADFWTIDNLQKLILALINAVRSMHQLNVIHRDLKPANILIKKGASMSNAVPFILDFNSSARLGDLCARSGTPRYLPPEVRAGKRLEPAEADDLWAVAVIAWELIFGLECPIEENPTIPPWLIGTPSAHLVNILRRSLELNPEARYATADDLLAAVEESPEVVVQPNNHISSDEFTDALKAMKVIRASIQEDLSSEGDLPIPKEVYDQISILFSWLSDENTQALDLVSDMLTIGPKALPASLEQGYKLSPETSSFNEVLKVLQSLGEKDAELASKSIAYYSLSSNMTVRFMCRELCKRLHIFPNILLSYLMEDEGILLSDERVDLADLCIKYSKDSSAILALTKYMCREYILDRDSYYDLRNVAYSISKLSFRDKALLVVEDTKIHIWEELPEFEKVEVGHKIDMEHGLLQLMADAFSGMGNEGLNLLKNNKVPKESTGTNRLPIFNTFALRLAKKHEDTCRWIKEQKMKNPADRDISFIIQRLEQNGTFVTQNDVSMIFNEYLKSIGTNKSAYNKLRFLRDTHLHLVIFSLIDNLLDDTPKETDKVKIIELLKGFENRCRDQVIDCILKHWDIFCLADLDKTMDILSSYKIRNGTLKSQVMQKLNSELDKPYKKIVRRGLERILSN